jgi:hypothetical protein
MTMANEYPGTRSLHEIVLCYIGALPCAHGGIYGAKYHVVFRPEIKGTP